jgi:hypothetical protein
MGYFMKWFFLGEWLVFAILFLVTVLRVPLVHTFSPFPPTELIPQVSWKIRTDKRTFWLNRMKERNHVRPMTPTVVFKMEGLQSEGRASALVTAFADFAGVSDAR